MVKMCAENHRRHPQIIMYPEPALSGIVLTEGCRTQYLLISYNRFIVDLIIWKFMMEEVNILT